jgi:two-component system, sensor histidine kinase and response regulator
MMAVERAASDWRSLPILTAVEMPWISALLAGTCKGVIGVDQEGLCRFYNKSLLQLLGLGPDAVLAGKHLLHILQYGKDWLSLRSDSCPAGETLQSGPQTESLQVRYWRRSSSSAISKHQFIPVEVGGRVIGQVITVEEVPERTRAECDLEGLFSLSPDMLCVISHSGMIERVNPAFCKLFGYNDQEMTSIPYLELVHADERDLAGRHLRTLLSGSSSSELQLRLRAKDGSYFQTEWNSAPSSDGKKFYTVGRDVTDRMRILNALQKAKDMSEATSRAQSEFLANISHELRTPMNGIIGMTELTQQTDLTEEQRDYLGVIKGSATALMSVIQKILDFADIGIGRVAARLAPLDLRGLVNHVLLESKAAAARKGLVVHSDIARNVSEGLSGDPGRIRQILGHLVENAVHFTDSGDILLTVDGMAAIDNGYELHFKVIDTGIGVPADRRESIFEAFSQADGSLTRRSGGAGLGLTICKLLAERMGGKIWYEDNPERKGSIFHVTVVVVREISRANGTTQ